MLVITFVLSDLEWRCLHSPFAACIAGHTQGHFTGRPILPATNYISELKGRLI